MAKYLLEFSYTSEAWAAQLVDPRNRVEAIRPVIERLGGQLECAYLAFGDYDVVVIADFPDAISASAFSLAVAAGGAGKAQRTTPLLTIDEGIAAMRQAAEAGYRPPGA